MAVSMCAAASCRCSTLAAVIRSYRPSRFHPQEADRILLNFLVLLDDLHARLLTPLQTMDSSEQLMSSC